MSVQEELGKVAHNIQSGFHMAEMSVCSNSGLLKLDLPALLPWVFIS